MASEKQSATPLPSEPPAGNYFVSAYPPFSCWSPETIDLYRESLARPAVKDEPFGLYVHIPFCVQRCRYCYYLAHDGKLGEAPGYVDAVIEEFASYAARPAFAGRPLSFAYFGGGTPSLLSRSQLERLFDGLKQGAGWERLEEATFECAPRSVTGDKMLLLRQAGITRLSLGVQQLNDDVLHENGRIHTVSDVRQAYESIRAADFPVVNLDLIVGLVGETERSFMDSLEAVIALAPDSVTLYQLEIPLNTPLYRSMRDGSLDHTPLDWDDKRSRLGHAFETLESAGYTINSAYCAVRDPERHRFVYQDAQYRGHDLLGIGVSSFSYLNGLHQQNRTRLSDYMEAVSNGRLPLGRAYALRPLERLVREFLLQLKLGQADLGALAGKHGVDPGGGFIETIDAMRHEGWLETEADCVKLTRAGLLRVDRLLPRLYLSEHRVARYS